jgi:hypothetical protein
MQPIVIVDGRLVDGQSRLWAIRQCGLTQRMDVRVERTVLDNRGQPLSPHLMRDEAGRAFAQRRAAADLKVRAM